MNPKITFADHLESLLDNRTEIDDILRELFVNSDANTLLVEQAFRYARDQNLLLLVQPRQRKVSGQRVVVHLAARRLQPAPSIENPRRIGLPRVGKDLLQALFAGYGRVVIDQEFTKGLSGSQVFLVQPIRMTQGGEQGELPIVVKLASTSLIAAEVKSFDHNVEGIFPNKANLIHQPVLLLGEDWGGLCYEMIGEGIYDIVSLRDYLSQASLTDVKHIMQQLVRIIRPNAQQSRPKLRFHLRQGYDRVLPVNLLVKPGPIPAGVTPLVIRADAPPPPESLEPGAYVRLEGFAIIKIDLIDKTVTLDHPDAVKNPLACYRVRLSALDHFTQEPDDPYVPLIEGQIEQTRQSQLHTEAAEAFRSALDLTQSTLSLPHDQTLPNPLMRLTQLLDQSPNIRVGLIHGDFNTENVLVLPDSRTVKLIDFSEAREDYILHDFLRLETEIMTKLVAELLYRHGLTTASFVTEFYQQLHWATIYADQFEVQPVTPVLEKPLAILKIIRQAAGEFLYERNNYQEYYQGLALHLIGALRYGNLKKAPSAPLPKQIAFWAAATALAFADGELGPTPLCPYRGLEFFDLEHAPYFFGREALTERLLAKIEHSLEANGDTPQRFLAIIGPSGSGKSSLARAGVVAALKRGAIKDSQTWPIAICRPGSEPLINLAQALAEISQPEQGQFELSELAQQLAENEKTLALVTRQLLPEMEGGQHLVLLVDQFEEIFTLCQDETLRRALLDNLLYAATAAGCQAMIVLILRADFYGKCAAYPELAQLLSDNQALVGSMSRVELRQAIKEPARRAICFFEPGLAQQLLDDIQGQAGGLPLLQVALQELWQHQEQRRLTHAAYQRIGRATGALQQQAETVYESLTETEKQLCRRIFLRLTQPGQGTDDTRRVATRDELATDWALVQRLANAHLIVTDCNAAGVETAEIVHEALIQNWARLQEWLEADRAFRVWLERLQIAIQQWQVNRQDEGGLLRGAPLAEAENWRDKRADDLSQSEKEFIQISAALQQRDRQDRERQRVKLIWGLSAGLVVAVVGLILMVGVAGYAVYQHSQAEKAELSAQNAAEEAHKQAEEAQKQKQEAEKQGQVALAGKLAAQAINYAESQPDLALLLSLEAGRIDPTHTSYETRHGLLTGLAADPRLVTYLREHIYNVNTLAYSPDGKILAAGSGDYTITLWDTDTNQLRARLTGHTEWVSQVAFSPDSTLLASAGGDGSVRLWDVAKGNQVAELNEHKAAVNSVAFDSDGKLLASASNDKTIILWNVKEGKSIKTLNVPGDYVYRLAFSPDGKMLASVGSDRRIILWNVETGEQLAQLTGHTDRVLSLAFSPNGQILASGSQDNSVILWDMTTQPYQQLGLPLTGHTNSVTDLAFSPDGHTLASSSWDKTIRVWDVATHQLLGLPLRGHGAVVNAVSFDPKNGQKLASGSGDSTIILWDLSNQSRLAKTIAEQPGEVWRLAVSPKDNLLASAGRDGNIILWDVPLKRLAGQSRVFALAFSHDGSLLASAHPDKNLVIIWRVEDGQELYRLTDHQIGSLAFSQASESAGSGSEFLAMGDSEGQIWFWDVSTGQQLSQPLKGHSGEVWSLAFSPATPTLASAGEDGQILLWDMVGGQQLGQLSDHTDIVWSVAFSPDGRTLASGSNDKTIRLWDLTVRPYRQIGQPLTGHTGRVFSVTFSPDGQTLASGSYDKTIILWDVLTQRPRFSPLAGHTEQILNVVFNSDPTKPILVSASSDNTIRLWNVQSGQPIGEPVTGHRGSVRSVTFSPDGQLLAWGGENESIILWDLKKEKGFYKIDIQAGYVNSVTFSPNSQYLAVGTTDGEVILWDIKQRKRLHPSLKGHTDNIRSVAFSPNGRFLASGSNDKSVILWDVATGRGNVLTPTEHITHVLSVTFSPDGSILASGGRDDKTVRLWDVEQRIHLPPLTGHSDGVNSIDFSPKGDMLALGTEDGKIYLWDIRTGIRVGQPLVSHHTWVSKIVFSPDGTMLASIGGDHQIILWDTATYQQLGPPLAGHQAVVRDLVFSPNGQSLFSVGDDGAIIHWAVGLTEVQTRACEIVGRNLTWQEWALSFDNRPYHLTCPNILLSSVELLNRADTFAQAGQREQARDMFAQAVEKVTQTNSVVLNNWVCWFGSLNRLPDIILPACERAVELAPSDNQRGMTHDSLGIAYTLLGEYPLAIENFEIAVSLLKDDEEKRLLFKRESWIADLQKGRNPFDDVILNALRFEN